MLPLTPKVKKEISELKQHSSDLITMTKQLTFASTLEVGDILVLRYPSYNYETRNTYNEYHRHEDTDTLVQYCVIHKDDGGLVYVQALGFEDVDVECIQAEMMHDGNEYEYHPDFIDHKIMGMDYDPVLVEKERQAHIRKTKMKNKKIITDTRNDANILRTFFSGLKEGDTFYYSDDECYFFEARFIKYNRRYQQVSFIEANRDEPHERTYDYDNYMFRYLTKTKPHSYSMVE